MKVFFQIVLGTVIVLGFLNAQTVDSVVKSTKGQVEYALPGSLSFRTAPAGLKLPVGSQVRTGPGSEAIVTVVSGAAIRLDEKTTITLNEMEFAKQGGRVTKRKATIDLADGTISALIDPRNPEVTDFRIKTPQGSAAARGTFYGVSVNKGQTFVKVNEGKVGFQKLAKDGQQKDAPKKNPGLASR
jgi:hypothetical protein